MQRQKNATECSSILSGHQTLSAKLLSESKNELTEIIVFSFLPFDRLWLILPKLTYLKQYLLNGH